MSVLKECELSESDGNVNMLWHWQLCGTLLMAVQATSLPEEALHVG